MVANYKKIIPFFLSLLALNSLFFSDRSCASPENDRVYRLETLAWLKSSDNADDMFAEFLDEQYSKYFSQQSRFIVKKISGIHSVLTRSDLPYSDLVNQTEVIRKIAQKFQVENLIRTKVSKEGETYRFVLEWLFAPKGDVLSQFEFRFVDPKKENGLKGSELPVAIENALDQLVLKLPFIGQVTGKEGDTITVNLGRNQNIHRRDTFVIYTLQGVRRHPQLKTIEEWRWAPVGRAEVEQVEDSLSFAKVVDTEPGMNVIRLQKIREVIPAPPEPKKNLVQDSEEKDLPRVGWIAGNAGLAFYSREVGTGTSATSRGGSGLGETIELESLLWFNSRWLGQLDLSGTLAHYSPTDLSTGNSIGTSYNGSSTLVRIAAGYSLLPQKTIFDPTGWVHAGYKYTGYSFPSTASDQVGGSSFESLFVGVGGEIPFKDYLNIQLGFDLGLIKGPTNKFPDFGVPTSSTDLMLHFGGGYRISDRMNLRMMVKINSQSMDFANGKSISQKTVSVGPSLLYYF